jgi:hypothetical protein
MKSPARIENIFASDQISPRNQLRLQLLFLVARCENVARFPLGRG